MNFVDAIDKARAWASEYRKLIYIDTRYDHGTPGDAYTVEWEPSLPNMTKFADRPVYRVWPDGKVERMVWTTQEYIPSE